MKRTIPAFLLALVAHSSLMAAEKTMVTFQKPDSLDTWPAVNDSVMGGVSKGGCKRTEEGTMIFRGEISLENNGGFSSIRSQLKELELTGMKEIVIKARGDGRTYWIDLREEDQMRASSYRAYLKTTAGEWQVISIPITDFKLQAFGEEFAGKPIKLEEVSSLGFTLADKKAGKFSLEIESVKASDEVSKTAAVEKKGDTIVDVATQAGTFKTLLAAATAADLVGALSAEGPLTVFAPTDEAFAKLPEGTVATLLKPENKGLLTSILKNHIVSGKISLAKALELKEGTTLLGTKLDLRFVDGKVRIGAANMLTADIEASNGIIHVIDQVLIPALPKETTPSAKGLIELAIDRGVPLFNHGDEAACAAIYEITCTALLSIPEVSKESRKLLVQALKNATAEDSAREKAWILREGLDQTWTSLSKGAK
jgi:uncharacterized surface protein with fasciclin (FAS1) repeats